MSSSAIISISACKNLPKVIPIDFVVHRNPIAQLSEFVDDEVGRLFAQAVLNHQSNAVNFHNFGVGDVWSLSQKALEGYAKLIVAAALLKQTTTVVEIHKRLQRVGARQCFRCAGPRAFELHQRLVAAHHTGVHCSIQYDIFECESW